MRFKSTLRLGIFRPTSVGEEGLHVQKLCQQYESGKLSSLLQYDLEPLFLYKVVILPSQMSPYFISNIWVKFYVVKMSCIDKISRSNSY